MSWLRPGSPPRSPHVSKPTFLGSYFPSSGGAGPAANAPRTSQRQTPFRPTRRDLILCVLTFSFAFLLFAPGSAVEDAEAVGPEGSSRFADLREHLFPSHYKSPASSTGNGLASYRELSFTESVSRVGAGAEGYDESEEEGEDDSFRMSTLLGHAPGWTLMEDVYIFNGSIYILTDDNESWPEMRMMTSTGLPALNVPGNEEAREPTGKEIIYITPREAVHMWGDRVWTMDGTTWLFNDGQFVDHYYHFAAELLLGAWRAYTSLDPNITPEGETTLPPPRRAWFMHQSQSEWRDKPGFNPTILFSVFPSISTLYKSDWQDVAYSTATSPPKAFLLHRVLLADRSAAFRGEYTAPTARTVASALRVGQASRWWWEPIRRQVLRWSGSPEDIINRSLEGIGAVDPVIVADPTLPGVAGLLPAGGEPLVPAVPKGDYKPVITYISRQSSRRRLTADSHADLVAALTARADKNDWELVIVEAERLSKEEQFVLAGRTTVMLGVHGNGLSHLLWMPATPQSTVVEMFVKGGFARDYQWTAHALGHRHFAVQHDITFTAPNIPQVDYPEGFQGESITVDANVVADLIQDRIAGRV